MSAGPRIAIIYSPVGNGHRSAAHNIAQAIADQRADADVEILNVLDFAPRSFRYEEAWRLIQRHGGRFWDWFFDATNRPWPAAVSRWREALNLRLLAPLVRHLIARQPDRIVCTHYLPAVAVAQLRRTGRLTGTSSVVVTDYLSHEAWINPGIDRYYVAAADIAQALVNRNVAAQAVQVAGIPVADDMNAAVSGPRIVTGRLRVLFLASGVSRRMVHAALASVAGIPNIDLDVVAGNDPGLARSLADGVAALGLQARVHGSLPSLKPIMQQAHVVVTKAGGLVVSECLAQGRGIVFPWPAPGHERGNRTQALAVGAAVGLDDPRRLGATLDRLARAPGRVVELGMAAAKAAPRGAAQRIARDLMQGLPAAASLPRRATSGAAR